MLLAFDIGNSNTVLGVFRDGELLTNWRIETDSHKSADEYGMLVKQLFADQKIDRKDIDDVIIATVVPSVLYTIRHMVMKYFGIVPIFSFPSRKDLYQKGITEVYSANFSGSIPDSPTTSSKSA